MKSILQWWVGYKLPLVHVQFDSGLKKLIADLVYHPIKRRISRLYVRYLQYFFGLIVIGITGSAGKTTTKEMLAQILRSEENTVWSKDNIDPVFNIPSTILRCTPLTKYLVLEMGVEYPNEMDFYLWLVKPKIGVITNIFTTHTLFFSDKEGVLKEKSKLVKNTKIAILNADDKYLLKLKFTLKGEEYWFRNGENAIETNKNAVIKIAEVLDIKISNIKYINLKHRLEIINHKSGAIILNDTYNSNPEAFLSTLNYFNKLAGKNKKIVVVGDMLELGKIEVDEHKRIGNEIKKFNFEKVFAVGKLVKYISSNLYTSPLEVLPDLKKYLKPNTYILLKGSRSMHLDTVVDQLVEI